MGLYKRDRVYWMSFSLQGKQIKKSCETSDKRLAEKIYGKILCQIAENKWFEVDKGRNITFLELAEKYKETEAQKIKCWRSIQGYFNQLADFFGTHCLSEIDSSLIEDFLQMRKSQGVTGATINRQLNILKRMLNLAHKRWKWIKEMPIIEMVPNADKKRIRHLSFEEYQKVLDCCDDWLKDIIAAAAWTGLRLGNIINLKKDQVNIFSRTIALDGSEMKNNENLIIPISAPALEALKNALKITQIKSSYIFCNKDGLPYGRMRVQRGFKRALKHAGIDDFRFHDLRHCFASWNRQAGVDIDTLADLMGHKDSRMSRRYAHITPIHLRNSIDLLDKSYANSITILAQSDKLEGVISAK